MKTLLLIVAVAASCCAQTVKVKIGPALFAGAGLNDATSGGVFVSAAQNAQYVVTISSTGTPDSFTWTKNPNTGGIASSPIAITGAAQALADGVTIAFAATTGHTAGNIWTIDTVANGTVQSTNFIHNLPGTKFRDTQSRLRDTAHLLDFNGVDPTGATPSATAIMAAWKAVAPTNGGVAGTLSVQCANYQIDQTVVLTSAYMGRFDGQGGCAQFTWTGNSTTPMFWLQDCFACEFANVRIIATSAHPLKYAIQTSTTGTGGIVETAHNIHNIEIEGGGALYTGVQIDGAVDSNNDQHTFREVHVFGYTHSAWTLGTPTTGFNIFNVTFDHDTFHGYCAASSPCYGVEVFHGNYSWKNGDGGSNTGCDFHFAGIGGSGYSIEDGEFEGSTCFIDSGGPGGLSVPVNIHGVLWDGGCLNNPTCAQNGGNGIAAPIDGDAITWKYFGPLEIKDSQFGSAASVGAALSICLSLGPTYDGPGISLEHDVFQTTLTQTSQLFRCAIPDTFKDVSWQDPAGNLHRYGREYLTSKPIVHDSATITNATAQNLANYQQTTTSLIAANISIGSAVFTGTGVNDASSGGFTTITATATWTIKIAAAGTGATPDTYQWKVNSGAFSTAAPITCGDLPSSLGPGGVTITWFQCTGHTAGDQWTITLTANPTAPVIMAGTGASGAQGTGSTVGPLQCGTGDGAYTPCLDMGREQSGPVLMGFRDAGNVGGIGFANRVGNTVGAPFFKSDSRFGTLSGGPYVFASWPGASGCTSTFDGYQVAITDGEHNSPGSLILTGGGSYHDSIQCNGSTGHWFVVGSEGSTGGVGVITVNGHSGPNVSLGTSCSTSIGVTTAPACTNAGCTTTATVITGISSVVTACAIP